jgi:hypothetical protein
VLCPDLSAGLLKVAKILKETVVPDVETQIVQYDSGTKCQIFAIEKSSFQLL